MIIKSYEIEKNISNFAKNNFYLIYGENSGLKKEISNTIKNAITKKDDNLETLSIYESEILDNEENFINFIYSGSLFGNKKIINVHEASDKIFKKISDIHANFNKSVFLIISCAILDKKSKLRNFFEKDKNTMCIACYPDNERDLGNIIRSELKKNKILLSSESINLLIEKSNSDRGNLRNEIEKIKSYALNKKNIEIDEIKNLINFSGDYKSDILINECLSGNILQYKKIISELYINTINQVLLLRILSNKIQRLLNIKKQETKSISLDNLINSTKPPIFWKEKTIVKKQLSVWKLNDLKKMVKEINDTELLCKKNPQVSNVIFFNFFLKICLLANSSS
jgi:DNA polymerase III subunit delta